MKKGFTLVEIIVVAIIVLILATLGLAGYQQLIENARQRVCATNLRALLAATEIYALEEDKVPASLGELKLEYLKKGYAKAINKRDWLTRFSYFFVKLNTSSQAYAQFLTPDNLEKYGVTKDIFHCPSVRISNVTREPVGPSYGLNPNLSASYDKWADIPGGEWIVADCNDFSCSGGFANRHFKIHWGGRTEFNQHIRKDRVIE